MKGSYLKAAAKPEQFPPADQPEIAVVGRSNVGKSSFVNRLLGKQGLARVSKTPGRTQLLHFFNTNQGFRLVDLPGYGFAKVPEAVRRAWKPMIEGYLVGRVCLALVISLVDVRHDPTSEDLGLHVWLEASKIPTLVVATKADKLSKNQLARQMRELGSRLQAGGLVAFSSVDGQGREKVLEAMHNAVKAHQAKAPAPQI